MALAASPQSGSPLNYVPRDDLTTTAQLQRRLAQESGDREAAKLALHRLKTAIDFYRNRLQSLIVRPVGIGAPGDDENMTQRVRDLVRDMELEVRAAVSDSNSSLMRSSLQFSPHQYPTSPQKGKNYEVLRQSLEEAQRRCESLNNDMVHQAEANEELVETLSTVKDANKKLLEQIREQGAQIATLTQTRVNDEERMDQMTRKHESDRELIRQDTQRQVLVVRDAGAEKYNQCYQYYNDKFRHVKTRTEMMQQDVIRLGRELQDRKSDISSLVNSTTGQLQVAEKEFVVQCDAPRVRHEQWKRDTEDNIGDLQVKLRAEREARDNEGLSWGHKHGTVVTDKEDVQSRMTRGLAQQSSIFQAEERALQSERHVWLEERAGLERQTDDYLQQKQTCKIGLDQLQRDIVAFETAISAANSEIGSLNQELVELKGRVREFDDSLATSVRSNEHLREQLEEQRQRFQQKNEEDLCECRAGYEQKLADIRIAHEADIAMSVKQVEAVEIDLSQQDDEFQKIKTNADATNEECVSVSRGVSMWRAQFEAAKAGREANEKDFLESKRIFQDQRLKLQAGVDRTEANCRGLDDEIKAQTIELHEFRRAATSRETEVSTRQSSAATALKECQDTLSGLKARFREAVDTRTRIEEEATSMRERMLELHIALERNLGSQAKILDEERVRLGDHLDTERRTAEHARDEFHREREMTANQLKRVHDESRNKLAVVEKQRVRMQETSRADLSQANQVLSQLQQHVKSLENDAARVNALLNESEANNSWVRQELSSQDRDAAIVLRQLEEDIRTATYSLDLAHREDASLAQQLDSAKQRQDQERHHLQRQVDDFNAASSPVVRRT